MELAGIAIDMPRMDEQLADLAKVIDNAQELAFAAIGHEVNLGSPKQLQTVLFDELQLPKTKKIKSGYTTDAASLKNLLEKTGHEFLVQLMAHRESSKLRQMLESLKKSVTEDGRIHTTYAQNVAATGRISSNNPNLQNIPIRSEEGRRVRGIFVVSDGYECLLSADYSQIEMRIMAHLSGDAGLIQAYKDGEDLHRFVGSNIFHVPTDQVTSAMRSKVKAMSYGLAYGLTSFGLSKQLEISVDEARTLMKDYFDRFGAVRDYLRGVVDQARIDGYTATIEGRRRYLPDLTSTDRQLRENAERIALNSPIQGSAADIIKRAMLGVHAELAAQGLKSRMLLQVHDELVLEVAAGEREAVEKLVTEQMGCRRGPQRSAGRPDRHRLQLVRGGALAVYGSARGVGPACRAGRRDSSGEKYVADKYEHPAVPRGRERTSSADYAQGTAWLRGVGIGFYDSRAKTTSWTKSWPCIAWTTAR